MLETEERWLVREVPPYGVDDPVEGWDIVRFGNPEEQLHDEQMMGCRWLDIRGG